jgi:hypothetical protein
LGVSGFGQPCPLSVRQLGAHQPVSVIETGIPELTTDTCAEAGACIGGLKSFALREMATLPQLLVRALSDSRPTTSTVTDGSGCGKPGGAAADGTHGALCGTLLPRSLTKRLPQPEERAMGLGGRVADRGQVATWSTRCIGRARASEALTRAPKQGQGEQRGWSRRVGA